MSSPLKRIWGIKMKKGKTVVKDSMGPRRYGKTAGAVMLFLFLMCSVCIQGCALSASPHSETGFYLNTVVTITVYRRRDVPLIQECFALCDSYEKMLSRTVEGSDIYRINHSNGESVEVSQETAWLLTQAISYAELSGGRIDPTVAPLMELWNFTGQASDEVSTQQEGNGGTEAGTNQTVTGETDSAPEHPDRVPAESDLLALLPHVNYKAIRIDGHTVTLTDPQARVDLGFIAKGYIADLMKEYLVGQGVTSAILNLGGNVLTIGQRPDGSPFQVGLQKPFGSQGEILAVLPVADRSMVSSGVYERCFEQDGRLYHHLLDPSTGHPVENGLLGVTILSDSSMEGDALSTTCFCMGPEEGMALVESLPGTEAVFIMEDYSLRTSSGITLP